MYVLLIALAALLVGACGSSGGASPGGGQAAGSKDSLVLTGTLKADSSAEKDGGGCSWLPSDFDLKFTSGEMQGGVVVAFHVIVGVGGLGDESAAIPLEPGGNTPLVLKSGGRTIKATQGMVHVTDAELGARKWKGTIDADFTDGTHITGGWTCQAGI